MESPRNRLVSWNRCTSGRTETPRDGLARGLSGPITVIVRLPIDARYINSQLRISVRRQTPMHAHPDLPGRAPRGLRQCLRAARVAPRGVGLRLARRSFPARFPVNETPRHKRDAALTTASPRVRTHNHSCGPAPTVPQPAPDPIPRSSAARFSCIITDERDSETLPRQRNRRRRPAPAGPA
jgi:hypothetical protein